MTLLPSHQLRAVNTAADSANRIHDDEIARRYGFSGGLVPGVDVFAWLCHPPAEAWGARWLETGRLDVRLLHPVYHGEEVVVGPSAEGECVGTGGDGGGGGAVLEVRSSEGQVCATALAHRAAPPAPDASLWPAPPLPQDPPPASESSLAPGVVLGALETTYRADRQLAYLDAISEHLPLFRDAGMAHPGFLLRTANWVLANNVTLGPWIHTGSDVALHRLVSDGDDMSTRARVLERFERKGHRFVVLDVLVVAGGEAALRARHTAIYEPRPAT